MRLWLEAIRCCCAAKGLRAAMIEAMRLLAADRRSWSGTLLGVFVADALAAALRHGVADARPLGFEGACDFVQFRAAGAMGVVLGPGDLAVAHKPDEFVPHDEFAASALICRDIAQRMLAS